MQPVVKSHGLIAVTQEFSTLNMGLIKRVKKDQLHTAGTKGEQ